MVKKLLVFIILFIIFYDIYIIFISEKNSKNNENIYTEQIETSNKYSENSYINKNKSNNKKNDISLEESYTDELYQEEFIDKPYISPNMFGKPTEFEKDNYIVWEFDEPSPWTKIVYKYNENYPLYFYIKIKIPSLNDYQDWKKIIPNINFNPRTGEIIIPTDDEETALSIINLIISNFKGDISIKDIINKNLIDISIDKAKKHDTVKQKLIEQINNNIKIKNNFLNDRELEKEKDTEDIIESIPIINKPSENHKSDQYIPYEGTEYSFI